MNKFRNKKVFIWGASKFLEEALSKNSLNLSFCKGIFDNDKNKIGQKFCGFNVYSPDEIAGFAPDVIISAVVNYDIISEIKKFTLSKGLDTEIISINELVKIRLDKPNLHFKNNREKLKEILSFAKSQTANIFKIPSMLTLEEKHLLYSLARYYYTGEGKIFDAGIFFGGCTEAFLKGLLENKKQADKTKQIWAYEYGYQVDTYKNHRLFNNSLGIKPLKNDFTNITFSYLNTLGHYDKINFIQGDILKMQYPDKIEIMFLDVCKTPEVNFRMQQLFTRLIPGKSVVVQQDYVYGELPYIKITMGYLKDYFEFIGATEWNSAVFMLKKPIPPEVLNINPYDKYSKKELIELHNYYNKYLTEEQIKKVKESELLI